MSIKVEKILKGSLDSIPTPSVKIQIMGVKVCLSCKGNVLPLHLSRPLFEFSLKVKVMGSNPGYLLKPFLLYGTVILLDIASGFVMFCKICLKVCSWNRVEVPTTK